MGRVSFTGRGGSTFPDMSVFSYIPRYTALHSRIKCTHYTACRGIGGEQYLLQISEESSPTDVTVFVVLHSACRQIAGCAVSGSVAPICANFQSTVYWSVVWHCATEAVVKRNTLCMWLIYVPRTVSCLCVAVWASEPCAALHEYPLCVIECVTCLPYIVPFVCVLPCVVPFVCNWVSHVLCRIPFVCNWAICLTQSTLYVIERHLPCIVPSVCESLPYTVSYICDWVMYLV